jgi:hypothetical protein
MYSNLDKLMGINKAFVSQTKWLESHFASIRSVTEPFNKAMLGPTITAKAMTDSLLPVSGLAEQIGGLIPRSSALSAFASIPDIFPKTTSFGLDNSFTAAWSSFSVGVEIPFPKPISLPIWETLSREWSGIAKSSEFLSDINKNLGELFEITGQEIDSNNDWHAEELETIEEKIIQLERNVIAEIQKTNPSLQSFFGIINIISFVMNIIMFVASMQGWFSSESESDSMLDALSGSESRIITEIQKHYSQPILSGSYGRLDRSAIVRMKPSANTGAISKITEGTLVQILTSKSKWIQISYYDLRSCSEKQGWILKKTVTKVFFSFDED